MTRIDGSFLPRGGPAFSLQIAITQAHDDAMRQAGYQTPPPVWVQAIIDTGADDTVITPSIALQAGLQALNDKAWVRTADGLDRFCKRYPARLIFDANFTQELVVVELPLSSPIDCLIGCDLLARGVFVYDGPLGKWHLTI